jgi:anti-anti-sigma regulatory factor
MTVRINFDSHKHGGTTISVHGWIEGDDEASELIRVARQAQGPVVIDLEELDTADPSGVSALRALAQEGARLSRASDFIKLLLESAGNRCKASAERSNGGFQ